MNLHLAEISRNVTPGNHAVVLLDGAGWHQTGDKLTVPDNISLLRLPGLFARAQSGREHLAIPAPELALNRVFETYEAIIEAACEAWRSLLAEPTTITSIGHRGWAHVGQK